jgi:short-subunit dehydrogenase
MGRTLKDMIVVITGASAGIGRALAEELSDRGARLVLSARRRDRLEELNRALGGGHLCARADVSQLDDCRELIDRSVARFGRIDTLVCNAGYGFYRRVEDTSPQAMREIIATNLFGTTDCIHFALPVLLRQERRDGYRGQIMIVSSCVARRGMVYIGAYSATKAAQLALAEALRVELCAARIAVTSVHPVQTRTEFGTVARSMGDVELPEAPVGQTVDVVVRKMIRAIERPRPEVWPSRASRWAFGLGTLMPGIIDHAVWSYGKRVERANPTTATSPVRSASDSEA